MANDSAELGSACSLLTVPRAVPVDTLIPALPSPEVAVWIRPVPITSQNQLPRLVIASNGRL